MSKVTRRAFLGFTATIGIKVASGQTKLERRGGGAMSKKRPNILLVITHDTGRHLGCYGRRVETPNLDALAEVGVKFTNAFCTAPQCSPSRASILTGLIPHRHGLIGLAHRGFRLREDIALLPKLLSQAGYSTHLFGVQHETQWNRVSELGYQYVHRPDSLSCLKVTPLLLQFLASDPPQPFFASVGFTETHRPFPKLTETPSQVKVPEFLPDAPQVRHDVAELNAAVKQVDESVGQIIAALKKHKLWDNTLLIFTTDHGIAFPGAKATLFDPGIEVALLMHGPDEFNGGKVIDGMVSNADLMPTLCEVAGVEPPENLDGKSLLPLVQGRVDKLHEQIFVELTYHAAYDPMRGIRTERFKYIRSFADRPFWLPPNVDNGLTKDWYRENRPEVFKTLRTREMLFDLQNDPLERTNLASDQKFEAILNEMRTKLEQWMGATDDPIRFGHVRPPEGARVTPARVWGPEEGVTDQFDPEKDEW
ncbi:MAG: sulfatase [Armatimonadota bacterium]